MILWDGKMSIKIIKIVATGYARAIKIRITYKARNLAFLQIQAHFQHYIFDIEKVRNKS